MLGALLLTALLTGQSSSAPNYSPHTQLERFRRLLSGASVAHSPLSKVVPTPAPEQDPYAHHSHGHPKWVTELEKQARQVSQQRFEIGGKIYKYGDLNETDGTFYAATHLQTDIEPGFFCPSKLYSGIAKIKKGTSFQVADETIEHDPFGAQACCFLDKTYQVLDIITMLRSCKSFSKGTTLNHEAVRQTTAGDQNQVKEFEGDFNSCNAEAVSSVFWHMRACCVDKVFFFDHSERACIRQLRGVMKNLIEAKRNMAKCINKGGPKDVNSCTLTEESLILAVNDLNAAAFNLLHMNGGGNAIADAAKELISLSDGTAEGTLKGIDVYLKTHKRKSGDVGLPSDGAICEGC